MKKRALHRRHKISGLTLEWWFVKSYFGFSHYEISE